MKKIVCLSVCLALSSSMNAGWSKKLKKAVKKSGVSHVVRAVSHTPAAVFDATAKAVHVVDSNVTKPIVKEVVKPVVHETKNVVHVVDKNVTQPIVNTVVKPVISTVESPIHQLKLSHITKEILSVEKLMIKPFQTVEHELSKVVQKPLDKPMHFLSDILVEVQSELAKHGAHMPIGNKELHLLFKTINGGSKIFKAGFLLETKQDPFAAVLHYFLPPLSAVCLASDVIEGTDAIAKVTKHYNDIISTLESKNLENISATSLNQYAMLIMKHQLKEERDQSVMLLTLTKDIGKAIESTIDTLSEHRVHVPNHLPGDVNLK